MGFSFFFFQSIIRQRRDSAAITARGHPILANPKEPLKTFFFLLFFSFYLRIQELRELTCVPVWSGPLFLELTGTSPAQLSCRSLSLLAEGGHYFVHTRIRCLLVCRLA